MSQSKHVTLVLDRDLLEHEKALHVRRMRSAVWVYLAVLARLPAGTDSIELDPKEMATAMGLPEGTVRSWLGHLRKGGYLKVERLNGHIRVSRIGAPIASEPAPPADPALKRFFTVAKLGRALGDSGNAEALQAALNLHGDEVLRSALARALAVPEHQIRRSRTALFLYFLKHLAHET